MTACDAARWQQPGDDVMTELLLVEAWALEFETVADPRSLRAEHREDLADEGDVLAIPIMRSPTRSRPDRRCAR